MKQELHDKLKILLEKQGKSVVQFANTFNYKLGTAASWFSGRTKPGFETLRDMSKFFSVTIDYLLDNDVVQIPNSIINNNTKHIPLINWVQAGVLTETVPDNYESIPVPIDTPDGCFALSVRGKSMEPDFLENDVIIVDPNLRPTTGNFVVAVTQSHEKATFKKYKERYTEEGKMYFILEPLNPEYPSFTSLQFEIQVVGVVRSYIRKL